MLSFSILFFIVVLVLISVVLTALNINLVYVDVFSTDCAVRVCVGWSYVLKLQGAERLLARDQHSTVVILHLVVSY